MAKKKVPWAKRRRRSIVIDFGTGEEHELKDPSYGPGKNLCDGGCKSSLFPRWHHSAEEACLCNKLNILRKVGEIKDYRRQVNYSLRDPEGNKAGFMIVDFEVETNDGRIEIWEYKGLENMIFKLKRALFKFNHPGIHYRTLTWKDLV